jgi:hypothetical protein
MGVDFTGSADGFFFLLLGGEVRCGHDRLLYRYIRACRLQLMGRSAIGISNAATWGPISRRTRLQALHASWSLERHKHPSHVSACERIRLCFFPTKRCIRYPPMMSKASARDNTSPSGASVFSAGTPIVSLRLLRAHPSSIWSQSHDTSIIDSLWASLAISIISFPLSTAYGRPLRCCAAYHGCKDSERALVGYRQGSSANDSRMLYLHWVSLFPGRWLDEPERAGFLSASCLCLYN